MLVGTSSNCRRRGKVAKDSPSEMILDGYLCGLADMRLSGFSFEFLGFVFCGFLCIV
jgi:hypothetical protein